jgi:hypothetical protein
MLRAILNLWELLGLVCLSGYAGAFLAGRKVPKLEERISPPWTAYERARDIGNLGFECGAAGGALILCGVFVGWWMGYIHLSGM